MSYTVIIPSRNLKNLRACLGRLDRRRALVVWDGDPDLDIPDKGRWRDLFQGVMGSRVIAGVKPFNYARNCNLGIQESSLNDVVLLNDDALMPGPMDGPLGKGLDILADSAAAFPEYGILVPLIKGVTSCEEQRYTLDRRLNACLQNGHHLPRPIKNHSVPFMCAYIRREVIEKVGLLDEDHLEDAQGRPIYTGEDDMYCARVRQAGFKLSVLDSVVVEHNVSLPSTFRTNADGTPREMSSKPAEDLYRRKFGSLPAR